MSQQELVRVEAELIRLRELYEETTYTEKLEVISKQLDSLKVYREELRVKLGITGEDGHQCDCCRRTLGELGTAAPLQYVEKEAWLCQQCAVMHQGLWRVERSRRIPNALGFLAEVRSGRWRPTGNERYEELAKLARGGEISS